MICEPSLGLSIVFAIYGLLIILGAIFGYNYKPSVFSVTIGSALMFVLGLILVPYMLAIFGGTCTVI